MLYIICALKSETQAFVDKFKLDKTKQNKTMRIVTSGIGIENMFNATTEIVKVMNKSDVIVNIGICGANHNYEIGELIDGFKQSISCVDYEVNNPNSFEVVDMESTGYLEATKEIKNRYMFKVVSDHFEPNKVTKDGTKKLIYDKIEDIIKKVAR